MTEKNTLGLTLGSKACLCRGCGRTFGGPSTFDEHRTGAWDARRCMTDAELRARGLRADPLGRWGRPMPEDQRQRLLRTRRVAA